VYRTNGYHRLTAPTDRLLLLLKLKKRIRKITERFKARWYA
jgi:hypothetical protein